MRYAATTVTEASRPIVLTVGRASHRRGFRRLSRWWLRVARTWTARPISTPQMLALQACARDPLAYVLTLSRILRAVFPVKRRYRLVGDPVRILMGLPDTLRGQVLKSLVTVPGSHRDESTAADDPIEVIRRAQRESVHGVAAKDAGPSLAIAALTVRAAYGDVWYYNPARWATSDGYAPFAVALVEFVGLQALDARRRLEVADGFALAHAKDPHKARRSFEMAAYPSEVS
jgi:hypothetical protein